MSEEKLDKIINVLEDIKANHKLTLANQERALEAQKEVKMVYKKLVKKLLVLVVIVFALIVLTQFIQ